MKEIPCHQIDAFTDRPFAGNPAAVCPLDAWLPDDVMQAIAMENALSETAFFVPRPGGDDFDLRWFTPAVEVDLCGHATLASGYLLLSRMAPERAGVTFHSRSGPLRVSRGKDGFTLDFPARPPQRSDTLVGLAEALRAPPREILRGARDDVAVFERAEDVRALAPDMTALVRLTEVFAVIATAPGTGRDSDVDFVSRFFTPAQGILEDPVTGSAHCTLAPMWAERLGRNPLRARQVSARGGELLCEVAGDRVRITGQAVLVKTGTLHLP